MKTNNFDVQMRERHQEVARTRKGGFGGSDAEMFYMVAVKGLSALSTITYKKRLRVAKGLDEYQQNFKTPEMQKGHEFEDWYSEQSFAPIAQREGLIVNNTFARNFGTFAHADFLGDGEVWELKCVSDPDEAENDYFEQLQWYYMLGADRVWLVVCDSRADSFESGCRMPVLVERDENVISYLREGISLVDKNWNNIDLTLPEEVSSNDLMPTEKTAALILKTCLSQIKEYERQAEQAKETLKNWMEANNIQKIDNEEYSINFVPESTTVTLDKSKLFKAHPEISEQDYLKISPKKSYIKITLK